VLHTKPKAVDRFAGHPAELLRQRKQVLAQPEQHSLSETRLLPESMGYRRIIQEPIKHVELPRVFCRGHSNRLVRSIKRIKPLAGTKSSTHRIGASGQLVPTIRCALIWINAAGEQGP